MKPFLGTLLVLFSFHMSRFFIAAFVRPLNRLEQFAYEWVVADHNVDRLVTLFNSLYVREGFRIVNKTPTQQTEIKAAALASAFELAPDRERN